MGKIKVEDILVAEAKGLMNTIKVLSGEIKNQIENSVNFKNSLEEQIKSEKSSFEESKDNLVNLELISRKTHMISADIEKLLIRMGVYTDVLNRCGHPIESEDEAEIKIIEMARSYSIDKNIFIYSAVDGKATVINEEYNQAVEKEIDNLSNDDTYLKRFYDKAKSNFINKNQ